MEELGDPWMRAADQARLTDVEQRRLANIEGQRAEPGTRVNGAARLALALPADLVEAIAERAAQIVADRPRAPEDGWLRGADRIAAYIDCPRSRVYALASARRIPIHHDGSALVARRSELDRWLRDGGGLRP